ncbi:MAG: glycosyltransferase family 2 protein [Halobacteriota archaeon]|uniref:glycosyltransferase family 2 protein n=1 Tax=Natronomonas sp. TaxID=2184060 RepID=UPI0039765941
MTNGNSQDASQIEEATDESTATPLVSVVITTYNRPSYLRKAIESVLRQRYDEIELIIVDDHSETDTRGAISDIETGSLSGFQYVRHDENRGANAARNTGIEAASGEYVAFLDDDDSWLPGKIGRQVDAFETADRSVGVVYTGIETIRRDGHGVEIPPPIEGDITKALLCRNVVGTMSVVMVRTEIAEIVPLDEEFPAWADLEWYINLSRRTDFKRLPEPLTVYEFTSHDRLSDDLDKKIRGYELFIDRFDSLAASYGWLFRRKMRGWAAERVGTAALTAGQYDHARRLFATAVASYPLEPTFAAYLLASTGGRVTHDMARWIRRIAT